MWCRVVTRTGLLMVGLGVILTVLVMAITRQTSPIQGRLTYLDFESHTYRINQLAGHQRSALVADRQIEKGQLNAALSLRLAWAPDGTKLAFLSIKSPGFPLLQLQLYDSLQNTVDLLVEFPDDAPSPSWSWSVDSQRLAYTDGGSLVTIITPDLRNIPSQTIDLKDHDLPIALVYSLLWSPTDPNLLAVWGVNPARRSYVVLLDTVNESSRQLMTGTVVLGDLSWSRDGQHLLYELPPSLNFSVKTGPTYLLLNIDTRNRRELSGSDASTKQAAWSPDGGLIALTGPANDTIRLVDPVAGRVIKELSIPSYQPVQDLIWSSDGRLLVFTISTRTNCDLHVLDVQTRYTLKLLSSPVEICLTPPVWSDS